MNKKILKTGLTLISYIAALILIVVYFKEIINGFHIFMKYCTPFIIGLLIAFFLNPPYRLFMKLFHKIRCPKILSRFLSTILVLCLAYAIIHGIIIIVIPQVVANFRNFFENFDNYLNTLQITLNSLTDRFNLESFDLTRIIPIIQNTGLKIQNSIVEWGPKAIGYTRKIISSLTSILIGIVFSIYILNARDRLLRQINRLSAAIFGKKTYNILHHIGTVILNTFDNYVVGQSVEAMILGSLCYLSMKALRFEYPGLISVVVAVTALVPVVGTIVGGAVGFVLYLLIDPVRAIVFLIFFTVLQQLENNLIYPKVVGGKLGLPGLWVLFAVMVGSQVGGFLGMLCGVPIFTIIYTLLKDLTIYREREKKYKAEEAEKASLKKRQNKQKNIQNQRLDQEQFQDLLEEIKMTSQMEALRNNALNDKSDKVFSDDEINLIKKDIYAKRKEAEDEETDVIFIPHSEEISQQVAEELSDAYTEDVPIILKESGNIFNPSDPKNRNPYLNNEDKASNTKPIPNRDKKDFQDEDFSKKSKVNDEDSQITKAEPKNTEDTKGMGFFSNKIRKSIRK